MAPRTAEHLNKREQNVFYEDINMPLNYRVTQITDCKQLPKVCIIFLYKRSSKPYLCTLKKKRGSGEGTKQNPLSGRAKLLTTNHNSYNYNSLQGKIKSLHIGTILLFS